MTQPENQAEALDEKALRSAFEAYGVIATKLPPRGMSIDRWAENAVEAAIRAYIASLPEAPAVQVVKALEKIAAAIRHGFISSDLETHRIMAKPGTKIEGGWIIGPTADDLRNIFVAIRDFAEAALQSSPPVKAAAVDGETLIAIAKANTANEEAAFHRGFKAAVPEGFMVVPKEPTVWMSAAGMRYIKELPAHHFQKFAGGIANSIYEKMISAYRPNDYPQFTPPVDGEALCRSPAIEALTPTDEQWAACESIQDRYDLMKRLIRAALASQHAVEGGAVAWADIPVTDETIDYVSKYGGRCRDCADNFGVCPGSLPCKLDERHAAIRHVLRAINYGMSHGFLPRPAAADAGVREPTHRHRKTGHLVRVIGTGRMQANGWFDPSKTISTANVDMREVVIYEHDGNLWARPVEEFNDGRFEPLSLAAKREQTR